MSLSITQIQTMNSEYLLYKNSLSNALSTLNAVVSSGTALFNDAKFASQFPTNWAAYQTYLTACGNAISSFIASFPTEPPLIS